MIAAARKQPNLLAPEILRLTTRTVKGKKGKAAQADDGAGNPRQPTMSRRRRVIAFEASRSGLPPIATVTRISRPQMYERRRACWLDFRRARKYDAPQPAYGLRLELVAPAR